MPLAASRMRRVALASVCAVFVGAAERPPAPAVDDAKSAAQAFLRAVRTANREPAGDSAAFTSSWTVLAKHDAAPIARALFRAHRDVAQTLRETDAARLVVSDSLRDALHGLRHDKKKGGRRHLQTTAKALRKERGALRSAADTRREFLEAARERIAALRSPAALHWLFGDGLGAAAHEPALRLAAARALAAAAPNGPSIDDLAAHLRRARSTTERVALASIATAHGEAATPLLPELGRQIGDRDPRARLAAARALVATRDPDAFPRVFDLLAAERGPAQRRVATVLENATNQAFGTVVGSWRAWWEAEGRAAATARSLASRAKQTKADQGRGKRGRRNRDDVDGGYYMGIPQDGEVLVYVLDISKSMLATIDRPFTGTTTRDDAKPTRLDACKDELIRSLGALRPDQHFQIVWFHEAVGTFREQPVPANETHLTAAKSFVRALEPQLGTDTYDALHVALASAAGGHAAKNSKHRADVVFLLTDGRPYVRHGGKSHGDRPALIERAVRDWNALGHVTLHTIGIGDGIAKGSLRRLAAQNGGECRLF